MRKPQRIFACVIVGIRNKKEVPIAFFENKKKADEFPKKFAPFIKEGGFIIGVDTKDGESSILIFSMDYKKQEVLAKFKDERAAHAMADAITQLQEDGGFYPTTVELERLKN